MRKSLLLGIIISLFIGNCNTSHAQTDTEFWFVAPEVSVNHGDVPILLRITTADLPADVNISMPANTNFPNLNYTINAYSTITIDFTALGLQHEVEHMYDFRDGISGKSNKGILIKTTNPVTAYYEVNKFINTDIFTLKGRNALGTEFYGIFQTVGYNMSTNLWTFPAYSALDIVATEENTTVTFKSTQNQKFFGYGIGTFNVILNKGETLSLIPDWSTDVPVGFPPTCPVGRYPNDVFGRAGADHLSGVKITSDKNIAITKKDDSVCYRCTDEWQSQCYDLIGDQLVPVNMLGFEYIAMKGYLSGLGEGDTPSREAPENVYIVATEDNTEIYFNGNVAPDTVINEGQTFVYEFWTDTTDLLHIRSNEKISVLHVTGFGCEVGGAILPSIDECKGSTQLAFSRSTSEGFYLNIMVTAGSEDSFYINNILQDGSAGTLFGPSDFKSVNGTSNWMVFRSENIDPSEIPVEMQSLISNKKGFFHIGLINGGLTSGCRYGYFSNYANNRITILTGGTSSSNTRICEGDTLQLQASGGISYSWTPSDYLNDPNIPFPTAVLPAGNHNYAVTISRPCYSDTIINIEIEVCENPTANFTLNTNTGTSPLTINISNIDSAYNHKWYWDDNDLTTPDYETESNLSFTHTYLNSSNSVETKDLTLIVENEYGCSDTLIETITINPEQVSEYNYTQWFAVPYGTDMHDNWEANLVITATDMDDITNITITQPYNPIMEPISISIDPSVTAIADIYFNAIELAKIMNNAYIENSSDPNPNISNSAIKIQSNKEIKAHYEYQRTMRNNDLFTLKGDNALGIDFWIPFQDEWNNHEYDMDPAFAQIIIATTEANTEINIDFPQDSYNIAAGKHTFTLAEPGMTMMFVPQKDATDNDEPNRNADYRLDGTHITSDKPIVVTISDDSVEKSGWDMIGDQLVPTQNIYGENTIGLEYLVIKGEVTTDANGNEKVFVLTTEDNTNISYQRKGEIGLSALPIAPIAGTQQSIDLLETAVPAHDYVYIVADKPVYVFHVAGFEGEMGGAVVPSIDENFGSLNANFVRTKTGDFYLPIITHADALNYFEISTNGGPFTPFLSDSDFEYTGIGDLYVIKKASYLLNEIALGTPVQIRNSKALFHLAVINEGPGTCQYGYFTNYSSNRGQAIIVNSGSDIITSCYGEEIQFMASGGTSYTWSSNTGSEVYLDNTTIAAPKAQLPVGIHIFQVLISRPNLLDTTVNTSAEIYENSVALFNVNKTSGCSPLEIEFENLSTEADTFLIDWENDGIFDTFLDNSMSQTILHSYINTTDYDTVYTILLKAWHRYRECYDTYEKQIIVHPQISAAFSVDQSEGCSPLNINITNNTTGEDSVLISYGDGTIEVFKSLTSINHFYKNTGTNVDTNQIEFITYNKFGCTDTVRTAVIVYPEVKANYAIDGNNYEGCNSRTVTFTNTSNDGVHEASRYLWEFDDGTSMDTTNNTINKFYNNTTSDDKTYNFKITARSIYGCTDDTTNSIDIYRAYANFTVDNNEGCSPVHVNVTNVSVGNQITTWNWDYADGHTENVVYPFPYSYFNASAINDTNKLVLEVTGTNGCSTRDSVEIVVYSQIKANFTIVETPATSCDSLTVAFNSNIIYPELASNTIYDWDFGDGASSSNSDPTHVYKNLVSATPISNIVSLHVETNQGCFYDTSAVVFVNPMVKAKTFIDQFEGCSPLTIDVIAQNYIGISTYNWNYGDGIGTTNLQNPTPYIYPANQSYLAQPAGDDIYKLILEVEDGTGSCVDRDTIDVTVYSEIVANFTPQNAANYHPFTVNFTDNSSSNVESWQWDFRDGSTSSLQNTENTFENFDPITKIFNVKLDVTSDRGCTDSAVYLVSVLPNVYSDFDINISEGCSPLSVTITNNSLSTGTEWYWYWDKDDNIINSEVLATADSIANITNFTKTFVNNSRTSRIDSLTLIVGDGIGNYRIFKRALTVHSAIDAQFVTNSATGEGCNPLTIDFTNTTINSVLNDWSFGDGENSSLNSPSHLFSNSTTYDTVFSVSLTTESIHGCTDNTVQQVVAYSNISSDFSIINKEGCSPLNTTIQNTSIGNAANTYQWFIDNVHVAGSPTNNSNFIHTFDNFGSSVRNYEIKLIATNQHECTSEKTDIITVYPDLVTEIVDSSNVSCSGTGDGFILVSILSGIPPYNYMWSTGETNPTITEIVEGMYAVTVSDANNCSTIDSIIISEPSQISIITDSYTESICPSQEGKIEISVYGGIPPYNYTWSSGENTQDIYNLDVGNYNVSVVDINGCFSSKNYHIDSVTSFNDEEICFVSVDPEIEMNKIIWEKTPNEGIEYYKIYRHNSSVDIYQNVALLPFNDAGYFVDSLADSQNEAIKYKISSINKCATESSRSSFHKSLYLNITNTSEKVMLEWEAYEIESGNLDITEYIIYRGSNASSLIPTDTISSNESNYTDNDPESLINEFYYRIVGVKSSACILSTNNEFNLIYSNLVKNDINTSIEMFSDQSINLKVFPNPFKDEISIEYELYSKSNIVIEVYDVIGKKVTTLKKKKEDIGFHKHLFNPKDYGYSSGIYYIKLIIDNQTISKKIIQTK